MTLVVLLHRQSIDEPESGRLRAWVVQENTKGRNLLAKRMLTGADYAKTLITTELQREFGGDVKIRWKEDPGV